MTAHTADTAISRTAGAYASPHGRYVLITAGGENVHTTAVRLAMPAARELLNALERAIADVDAREMGE